MNAAHNLPGQAARRPGEWASFRGAPVPQRCDPYEVAYDFIRALHHRLCQPLTAMCCALEMVQMSGEEDHNLKEQLQLAVAQSERALEMMSSFRQLFEAETPEHERQSASLHCVLREVVSDVRPLAETFGTVLDVKLTSEGNVGMSPRMLRQTLWNVLQNCIESSAKHSAIQARVDAANLVVSDGAVISEDEMTSLLDPFAYCVNRSTSVRVSNLPLAIAQRMVTCAGGSMTVGKNGEKGRRFEIRLPSA